MHDEEYSGWYRSGNPEPQHPPEPEIPEAYLYDADGTTKRNMAVSLTRTSGAAIATGTAANGTTLLDSFVTSSGAEDTSSYTGSPTPASR